MEFCPSCRVRESRTGQPGDTCWMCATAIFERPAFELVVTTERRRFHVVNTRTGEIVARYVHKRDAERCVAQEIRWDAARKAVA